MSNDISDEEKNLFRNSQKQTRRLKSSDKIIPQKPNVKAKRITQTEFKDTPPLLDHSIAIAKVGGEAFLSFQRSGVQPRTLRQLRQGKLPPTATLDLHGTTVHAAEDELAVFLTSCISSGKRILRIIHGKGHTSKQLYPPIKNAVNEFLQRHPMVLAFASAPMNDGGTGAVYVLLKRTVNDEKS